MPFKFNEKPKLAANAKYQGVIANVVITEDPETDKTDVKLSIHVQGFMPSTVSYTNVQDIDSPGNQTLSILLQDLQYNGSDDLIDFMKNKEVSISTYANAEFINLRLAAKKVNAATVLASVSKK